MKPVPPPTEEWPVLVRSDVYRLLLDARSALAGKLPMAERRELLRRLQEATAR